MQQIMRVTFKGIIKDRTLQGVGLLSLFFLLIPVISALSMRQVAELSITLSVSFISFLLLILAIFLGGTQLWKDIERRYTFSVLSLPISRERYLLGKFLAVVLFMVLVATFCLVATLVVVKVSATMYVPDRPVVWENIVLCVVFDVMKSIVLIAFAFLFSTVSTSMFLPIFSVIAIYFSGSASQQVFEYLTAGGGKQLPAMLRLAAQGLYYVIPNLSCFDLKTYAIYAVKPDPAGLLYASGYFIVYTAIILVCATMVFSRKEMN